MWLWSRVASRPVRRAPYEPQVTLLVPAYNEAAWVEAKIRNTRELDYPAEKLELLIASDGSKDATAEIAARHADDKRIRLLDYKENSGKLVPWYRTTF
ncbi:MAG: glycosyltransferase [Candidatus Solibacter usitatus]|nr:glycosyltransferase [Candidatus Solibacter usitatus]